jgi:hypothetical protein
MATDCKSVSFNSRWFKSNLFQIYKYKRNRFKSYLMKNYLKKSTKYKSYLYFFLYQKSFTIKSYAIGQNQIYFDTQGGINYGYYSYLPYNAYQRQF